MEYALKYNAFHNLEAIAVKGDENNEDINLIKYTYKNGNGRLKEMTYANGDKMTATYNGIGQMIAEKWYNKNNIPTAHYKYVYDGQGNIVRSIDILARKEYNYLYEDGKLMRSTESVIVLDENTNIIVSKTFACAVTYCYDAEDTLTKKQIKFADGKEFTENYEKTENDSQIVKFTAGGKNVTSHSKNDSFGRKVFDELQLSTGFVSRQFSYHEGVATDEHKNNDMLKSSPTTQLVSQIVLSGGRTISYEYDEEERITKVDDSIDGITEYTYDALGQLVAERHKENGVEVFTTVNEMTYDNYGNILTKNGVVYDYDTVWKDKLIKVGDKTITYDEQGNPTQYLGHNLTWEKGRQLKSFDNIQYTYNANGIRTSKTVDNIRHDFVLDGAKILREAWENNTLVPLYDNEETVCGIEFNGAAYYFLKNLQGDIIAITNSSGEEVARYTYDAWGKVTVFDTNGVDITERTTHIANINPFRYRSYYFDLESGLYYLQSRYYDPFVGRFVNGDGFLDVSSIINTNLFTYCLNDSINRIDLEGYVSVSCKKISIGKIKVTINFSDSDIRKVKLGITVYGIIFSAVMTILGKAGILATWGISDLAATVVTVVVDAAIGILLAYIGYKDYGKGAKIEFYIKYGYTIIYYFYKIRIKRRYILCLGKFKAPYAYLYKLPKFTWNR